MDIKEGAHLEHGRVNGLLVDVDEFSGGRVDSEGPEEGNGSREVELGALSIVRTRQRAV